MRVIGLDLSLIRPGIAAIDPGLPPLAGTLFLPSIPKPCKLVVAKPATARRLKAVKAKPAVPFNLESRLNRLRVTRDYVRQLVAAGPVALAVMERMYVDRASDDVLERAWVWGIVAEDLSRLGVPVALVPPSSLKVYATGDAQADKEAMLAAAQAAWPDVDFEDHNASDAVWLAAMGARYIGSPRDDPWPFRLAGMDGAEWPPLISDNGSFGAA